MITVDTRTAAVLQRSFKLSVRAESWLGGTLLADGIPISAGQEQGAGSAQVPERVTLTVPRRAGGYDWTPFDDYSPLAANGQRLRIEVGISVGDQIVTWLQRGWFVITKSEMSGPAISVEAANLLWLVQEARLVAPFQPTGTLLSSVRTLLEPTLTVQDSGLGDRAVPAGINIDEDRLGGFYEILDAWPARGRVTEDGFMLLSPDVQPTDPVHTLTDGVGGTTIEFNGSSSRDGGFTMIVARGQDSAGNQVQGVAYSDRGSRAYGGTFNPQPVPDFFFSPFLTTVEQARAAAQTRLARRRRESGREFTARIVPDPRLQLGDPIAITAGPYAGLLCTLEGYTLPYVASGGAMPITLRTVV